MSISAWATVYRVLTQFERLAFWCAIAESGKAVYELDEGAPRPYGVHELRPCDRVFSPEIEELQNKIAEQHNFTSASIRCICTANARFACAGKSAGKSRG